MGATPSRDDLLAMLTEVFAECLPDRKIGVEDPLIGPDAQVDSMDLVTYVADVQEAIYERWQRDLVLADERALSRNKSPFRNLAALGEYIEELFNEE